MGPMHASLPAIKLPTPIDAFGRVPLDDDVIRWPEMLAYYERLAELDDRLTVEQIGRDWSGQPLVMLTITSRSEKPRRIMAITASIHADELGGAQMLPGLIHELLTTTDAELANALSLLTVLVVPCLNPGGLELIADWRARSKGQPWRGSPPPTPLHPVGHDLNRDWIVQTQPETRAVVDRVFNRHRPNLVLDVHEMAPNGARYALPPYAPPSDPAIPIDLERRAGNLGEAIAEAMTRQGKTGIVTGRFFDSFSPARSYLPYHGGVRVLCEAAGTRCGLPIHLSTDELANYADYDPRSNADPTRPPWSGGRWSLRDVGEHHRIAILAAMLHVSRWSDFPAATASTETFVVLPIAMQPDPPAARALIATLQRGGLVLRRATHPFELQAAALPVGSIIVAIDQPNGPWAKTLLSVQRYVHSSTNVPPTYDVTAQTLPLLMGVDVIRVEESIDVASEPLAPISDADSPALWGSVGVHQSRRPDASEFGWAATMLANAGARVSPLTDEAIRAGEFGDFAALVLPHQSPEHLLDGLNLADYPREYVGGIGNLGMARLKTWVENGGTLIAIDGSARAVVRGMHLPIEFVDNGFRAPGSILRLELDESHWLTRGCGSEIAMMNVNSPALVCNGDGAGIADVGRYPQGDPLLSGLLEGWTALAGRTALAEASIGRGRVVLFGFRPLFRGQSLSAQRLVINAIRHARKEPHT